MDELKYDFLTEVQGRWQAELLKSFFEADGVAVELFQESLGQSIYPSSLDILGNVQIFVPKAQLTKARELLKEFYNPPQIEKPIRKSGSKSLDSKTKAVKRKPK